MLVAQFFIILKVEDIVSKGRTNTFTKIKPKVNANFV